MRPNRLAGLLLIGIICTWLALAPRHDAAVPGRGAAEFYFHHDHILGTSLDVWLKAPDEAGAAAAEDAILGEIERLRRIFSLYDAASELSRLNRVRTMTVSAEMIDVLRSYERFQTCSGGAFSGQLGELVRVWQEAEKAGREPDAATLSRIVHEIRAPGWRLDKATRLVTRLTDQPLNLNSIAKGYIIRKAAQAARARVAGLEGLLLNLGGDMFAWDKVETGGWTIGVQDPREPQDNAEPIARLRLRDHAVATSGGYERCYTIGGKRHSHIFDPRTGRSAQGASSATVIATDNVTANALATTLCVLTPEEGLRLVTTLPGVECLLVTADGRQLRSDGFAAFEVAAAGATTTAGEKGTEKGADAWPEGLQVNLTLTLPSLASPRYRRPYVAIWVENGEAKPLRTITVWGNNPRYFKDLPQWWKFAKNDAPLVKAVTRATRSPGKYTLVWDGKDDKGAALPQGTYTIYVEVHREHGKLVRQVGKLTCGAEPATLTLEKNAETGDTLIEYAKKKK